jgi:hypothetical protein
MKSLEIFCAITLLLMLVMGAIVPAPGLPVTVSVGLPPSAIGYNPKSADQILFDDFSYTSHNNLKKNGWIIRTAAGWPGVPGATWSEEGVSLLKEAEASNNSILRMTSSTDGTGANTLQTQICHQRKYLEGTYAARVRFTDKPVSGPAGDQIVESFYTISPLKAPWDPDYSELDWEYLPNGGWGIDGPTLYATTWETFFPEPNWKKDNVFKTTNGSQAGWHTLITQVVEGKVKYFVDGKLFVEHSGDYYPEDTMSINFNLWFIRDGFVKASEGSENAGDGLVKANKGLVKVGGGLVKVGEGSGKASDGPVKANEGLGKVGEGSVKASNGLGKVSESRRYHEDIDWVFHQVGIALTPEQVEAKVASLRRKSVKFQDTVPPKVPALTSPCNF